MEDVIARAVVVPLERDDVLFAGKGPGKPQRGYDRFGTGAGKTQQVDVREQSLDLLGHAHRDFGRKAKLRAALGNLANDGVDDRRRSMSEDQRAIGHVQIDVLLAVDVPDA